VGFERLRRGSEHVEHMYCGESADGEVGRFPLVVITQTSTMGYRLGAYVILFCTLHL
jgi:hypothetical protein